MSGIGSAILYKIVDIVIGLRPEPDASAKASTSRITANALTICEFLLLTT